MTGSINAEPFTLRVSDEALSDLRDRLKRTRWPNEPAGPAWSYGTSLAYMKEVVAYWRDTYDWRRCEAEINRWPNYQATVGGQKLHVIVERGSGANPPPVILTHGWPGSIVEFLDVIEPLAHPERHGGNIEDAFTVVVPSMPGFGFSAPPPAPITPRQIAELWHRLMTHALGFDKYFAQGGDFGSVISSWLAIDHPDSIPAIHVNFAPLRPYLGEGASPLLPVEEAWLAAAKKRTGGELAYQQLQGTKAQTLAYGLTDSPAGLAAWILEKFRGWTKPDADGLPPFPLDRLLDNVMLYWLGNVNATTWLYRSLVEGTADHLARGERVEIPTGLLLFPDDILPPAPEAWLSRSYNVKHLKIADAGGHFAALENGALLVNDIRTFFKPYRDFPKVERP